MAFSARSCLGIAAVAHAVAGATGLALEPRLGRGRPLAQRRVNVRLYNAASDEGFPTVLPASGGNATQQDGALSATSTRPSVTATLAEPAADESEWTELILGAVNTTAATAERVLKDITAALGSKPEPPPPKPKPWWKGGGVGGGGSSGNNAAQQQQRKAKPDPAAAKARAPRNPRPTARGGANKAAPAPAKKEGFTLPWAAPKPEPEPEPRGAFDWLLRRGSAPAPAPPPPPPPAWEVFVEAKPGETFRHVRAEAGHVYWIAEGGGGADGGGPREGGGTRVRRIVTRGCLAGREDAEPADGRGVAAFAPLDGGVAYFDEDGAARAPSGTVRCSRSLLCYGLPTDRPGSGRGGAAAAARIFRRGRAAAAAARIFRWGRVAAAPRLPRGYSADARRLPRTRRRRRRQSMPRPQKSHRQRTSSELGRAVSTERPTCQPRPVPSDDPRDTRGVAATRLPE